MPSDQHDEVSCQALTPVFTLLGKRWSGLIIGTLLSGPARFAEICRHVPGVSERMLSGRLNELVGAGLVERRVLAGPPVGVEYRLTPVRRSPSAGAERAGPLGDRTPGITRPGLSRG